MSKALVAVTLVVAVVVIGGGVLLTWEIPAPTTQVEKVIPDDRFPR
ncbi:MAG: hypothetical protein QNJ06_03070 [Kiloniellales bacterium]|nr:hypothetical protein [Kiloniellales bacterium]MDJ0968857.1 hypothetical protein [Kiloniellales bacterium]MDJ0981921.1 hypothetical protein [Kiloniellales bacterium]